MAKAACPNGHRMWNGDGKPVVWAFRVGFFRDFMKEHPDCVLEDGTEYRQMYDCVDEVQGEDLDCWYCDECKGLVVYVDLARYDFKRMDILPDIKTGDLTGWEDYIAMRDWEFHDFQDFYEGKSPLKAIEQYDFKYRYKVSPDKRTIFAFDKKGTVVFGYYRACCVEYAPDFEIVFTAGGDCIPYRPYNWAKGILDIHVKPGQYAFTKDGRTIVIDSVIKEGERYRGRDIHNAQAAVVVDHSDISHIADEISRQET